jgi:hypothetical protein
MAIVDLQCRDRRKRHQQNLGAVDFVPMDGDDDSVEVVDDFDIRHLCNLISRPLRSGTYQYRSGPQRPVPELQPLLRHFFEKGRTLT